MERRIRVKCPDCQATIEIRVDQEQLVDVHCPRCRIEFTARVPEPVVVQAVQPSAVRIAQPQVVEVAHEEPIEPARPKRIRKLPKKDAVAQQQTYQPQYPTQNHGYGYTPYTGTQIQSSSSSPAFSPKAFIIATVTMLSLGLLVGLGIMAWSIISSMDFSGSTLASSSTTSSDLPATTNLPDSTASPVASATPVSNSSMPSSSMSAGSTTSIAPTASPFAPPAAEYPKAGSLPMAGTGGSSDSSGEFGGMTRRVVEQAQILGNATMSGDYEFIADQTYHGLVKRMGGRAGLVSVTRKAFESMKTTGTVIHNYTVKNNVTIKRAGSKIFAVVPISSEISVRERRVTSNSFLLAISEDNGETFTFLDGSGLKDEAARRSIVPDLPIDLTLPTSSAIVP